MILFSPKQVPWWKTRLKFSFNGKEYFYFVHQHNCGWPPYRMTERSVELALADSWLSRYEKDSEVIEIGAVTPYYWPCRVLNVVDPSDQHPLVSSRSSFFDISLHAKRVLSISTFEHIGSGEYNLENNEGLALQAVEKLLSEASIFLVTIPIGYNKALEEYILRAEGSFKDVTVSFMKRGTWVMNNAWRQVLASEVVGASYTIGANGLIILER